MDSVDLPTMDGEFKIVVTPPKGDDGSNPGVNGLRLALGAQFSRSLLLGSERSR